MRQGLQGLATPVSSWKIHCSSTLNSSISGRRVLPPGLTHEKGFTRFYI